MIEATLNERSSGRLFPLRESQHRRKLVVTLSFVVTLAAMQTSSLSASCSARVFYLAWTTSLFPANRFSFSAWQTRSPSPGMWGNRCPSAGPRVTYVVRSLERKESVAKLLVGSDILVCDVEHESRLPGCGTGWPRRAKFHGLLHSIAFAD